MIEPLVLEQSTGRGQVFVAVVNATSTGKRAQQSRVNALVEWRQLKPCLQVRKDLVAGNDQRKVLQHGDTATAKTPPLGGQPSLEERAAVDFQTVEKLPGKHRAQRFQTLRRKILDALGGRAADLDRVDVTAREVEADGVGLCPDPAAVGAVDEAPDLTQAPAKLPARVLGHVPQQIAESAARDRMRSERQIGE